MSFIPEEQLCAEQTHQIKGKKQIQFVQRCTEKLVLLLTEQIMHELKVSAQQMT